MCATCKSHVVQLRGSVARRHAGRVTRRATILLYAGAIAIAGLSIWAASPTLQAETRVLFDRVKGCAGCQRRRQALERMWAQAHEAVNHGRTLGAVDGVSAEPVVERMSCGHLGPLGSGSSSSRVIVIVWLSRCDVGQFRSMGRFWLPDYDGLDRVTVSQ